LTIKVVDRIYSGDFAKGETILRHLPAKERLKD